MTKDKNLDNGGLSNDLEDFFPGIQTGNQEKI